MRGKALNEIFCFINEWLKVLTRSSKAVLVRNMSDQVADKDTTDVLLKLARNIKEQRLSKGLKQTDMSQYGFGYRWYQRLESGRHVPTLPTLIKLSRALGIELSDLFR